VAGAETDHTRGAVAGGRGGGDAREEGFDLLVREDSYKRLTRVELEMESGLWFDLSSGISREEPLSRPGDRDD
jgi:hypothetical protein